MTVDDATKQRLNAGVLVSTVGALTLTLGIAAFGNPAYMALIAGYALGAGSIIILDGLAGADRDA